MVSKVFKGKEGERLPKNTERRDRWLAMSAEPEELITELTDCVAQGESLHAWCKRKDMAYNTVNDWINRVPARKEQYERARIARAEWHVSDIESMMTEVRRGDLDPSAARVIAENKRWLASRMDPHLWGEKVQIEANVNIHQKYLEAIKGLTIEGEYEHVDDAET
jgi:CCR4-NOT transcriptional regulation complex NOT5 subunit